MPTNDSHVSPFFSIIIPTFNAELHIQGALESIRAQSFTDYEVLVMDGLSTDVTLSLVESAGCPNCTVYSEKDEGIYDAFNKGVQFSKGDWVYFMGADDRLYADHVLENVHAAIVRYRQCSDLDVVYGNVVIPNSGRQYRGEFYLEKLIVYTIPHQAMFFKTKFLQDNPYSLTFSTRADYKLMLESFPRSPDKWKYIGGCLAYYAEDGVSALENDWDFIEERVDLTFRCMKGRVNVYNIYYHISLAIYYELRNKGLKVFMAYLVSSSRTLRLIAYFLFLFLPIYTCKRLLGKTKIPH